MAPIQPARVQFSGQEKVLTARFSPFSHIRGTQEPGLRVLSQGQKFSVASGLGSSAENSPPAESDLLTFESPENYVKDQDNQWPGLRWSEVLCPTCGVSQKSWLCRRIQCLSACMGSPGAPVVLGPLRED